MGERGLAYVQRLGRFGDVGMAGDDAEKPDSIEVHGALASVPQEKLAHDIPAWGKKQTSLRVMSIPSYQP